MTTALLIGVVGSGPAPDLSGASRGISALVGQAGPDVACSYIFWPAATLRRRRSKPVALDAAAEIGETICSAWPAANSSKSSLLELLATLPDLISAHAVAVVIGDAPRTTLTTACSRALRVLLLGLKQTRLIWLDTAGDPPKSGTVAFGRTLARAGAALIVPGQLKTHLRSFRVSTMPLLPPTTQTIVKAALVWPGSPAVSVAAFNIKGRLTATSTFGLGECRRALLLDMDEALDAPASWIFLRKAHAGLACATRDNRVALTQTCGGEHALLFPITNAMFCVFRIGHETLSRLRQCIREVPLTDDGVEAVVEPLDLWGHPSPSQGDERTEFHGELISGPVREWDAQVKLDWETLDSVQDPVAERVQALRDLHKRKMAGDPADSVADVTNADVAVDNPLQSWAKYILDGTIDMADASRTLKAVERSFQSTRGIDRQACRQIVLQSLYRILDGSCSGTDRLQFLKLQIICDFEVARLTESPDPMVAVTGLKRRAAMLAVLLSDAPHDSLRTFLGQVIYKQYGALFPLTLLDIYEDLDVRPPTLLGAPVSEDDSIPSTLRVSTPRLDSLEDEFVPTAEFRLSSPRRRSSVDDGSTLLDMISNEGSLKRRRTISGHIASLSRADSQVRWSRSFTDRESKRRRSEGRSQHRDNSDLSQQRTHVLVEASPSRMEAGGLFSPRRTAVLSSLGLSVTESPQVASSSRSLHNLTSPRRRSSMSACPTVHRVLRFDDDDDTVIPPR